MSVGVLSIGCGGWLHSIRRPQLSTGISTFSVLRCGHVNFGDVMRLINRTPKCKLIEQVCRTARELQDYGAAVIVLIVQDLYFNILRNLGQDSVISQD